jgi:glycosyltransferase involved in cell wall biosynthesis
MSELAYRLGEALAGLVDVSIAIPSELEGASDDGVRLHRLLTDGGSRDSRRLEKLEVTAWILLQAGLLPLARQLSRPAFGYIHGNDFLAPWLPCGNRWVEAIKRPYAARLRHAHRQQSIRRAVADVGHIYANSTNTRELFLKRIGAPEAKVTVVPPGVADECFRSSRAVVESQRLELLTVARLSPFTRRKNVDGVLRALTLLPASLDVGYRIVGGGDDRLRLEQLAADLGLTGKVEFLGETTRSEVLSAYQAADLFVLASAATEEDVEGFGIVYLEANAAGVPVLASRSGGAVDAVVDGVTGILLEESTPAAIADGIARFAVERERFSQQAIVDHAERHRWPRIAARLLADLRDRLQGGSIAAAVLA